MTAATVQHHHPRLPGKQGSSEISSLYMQQISSTSLKRTLSLPLSARSNASNIPSEEGRKKSARAKTSGKLLSTHTDTPENSPASKKGCEEDGAVSKKKRKKKLSEEVRVDLSCCKYEILRIVIQKMGWQEASDDRGWHLIWTDTSIGPERLMTMRRGQKVNHFLGMLQICRKKSLARHLSNMRRMFPADYKFFPRAFILPNHIQELVMRLNSDRLRTYILKPDNGCQGRGVVLVQNVADLKQAIGSMAGSNMLAQKYLTNPMLLNGYKFDLRIYALILSCDPLRLFLYKEGLARFCTEKYMKPEKANLKSSCMHLTNYAVNKNNSNFEFNSSLAETDRGSKWTLTSLFKALAARGYDTGRLKRQIRKMVVMTIISIVPLLIHNYRNCVNEDDNGRTCFELLGMDVLLDDKCRPWLLEVNHSPSFAIDTPLDFKVKESLLTDTLRLLNIDPSDLSRYKLQDKKGSKMRLYGRNQQITKDDLENMSPQSRHVQGHCRPTEYDDFEHKNLGNFDRIYPPDDSNLQMLYDVFLAGSEELFKQSFDMKVKNAILKAQEIRKREEMEKEAAEKRKQKKLHEMRKKAQESAKLALSQYQQQQQQLAACTNKNQVQCSNETLSDIGNRIIFDMASPHSSVETPTGWEKARTALDTVPLPERRKEQLMEEKLVTNVHPTNRAYSDADKINVQQEISIDYLTKEVSGNTDLSRTRGNSKAPTRIMHQAEKYAYGQTSAIPRLSSLPCIVPQGFYRHHARKTSNFQPSRPGKVPMLDPDSLLVRRHYLTRTSLELERESLLERRTANFLSTRSYAGGLPRFRGSPFPLCSMDSVPFLVGQTNEAFPDDHRCPFRSSAVNFMMPKNERITAQSLKKSRYGNFRRAGGC
ncbi:hypothetical protein KP509_04G010200 [Ceratopteris richardii]|uniref:Uncharacterized protein n=2 Tax=Ceratopteris richardii TaxID=49495 RepID=A0A8T2UXM3_CERRI|nr:hypothetical protein KP509_04G010200 [Ceratopteris richardii]